MANDIKRTKEMMGRYMHSRWMLATPIWWVLIVGFGLAVLCGLCGSKLTLVGAILICTSIISGWQYPKLRWREYLGTEYRNDMWVTPDGIATASGFMGQHGEFRTLARVAESSRSKKKQDRGFVKNTALYYQRLIEGANVITVLLGTIFQAF